MQHFFISEITLKGFHLHLYSDSHQYVVSTVFYISQRTVTNYTGIKQQLGLRYDSAIEQDETKNKFVDIFLIGRSVGHFFILSGERAMKFCIFQNALMYTHHPMYTIPTDNLS